MVTPVLAVLVVAINFRDATRVASRARRNTGLRRRLSLNMAVVRAHRLGKPVSLVDLRSPSPRSAISWKCLQGLEGLGRAGGMPDSRRCCSGHRHVSLVASLVQTVRSGPQHVEIASWKADQGLAQTRVYVRIPPARVACPTIQVCSLPSSGAGISHFHGASWATIQVMCLCGVAGTPAAAKTGCHTALLVVLLVLTWLQDLPSMATSRVGIVVLGAHQPGCLCLGACWWVVGYMGERGPRGRSPLCASQR